MDESSGATKVSDPINTCSYLVVLQPTAAAATEILQRCKTYEEVLTFCDNFPPSHTQVLTCFPQEEALRFNLVVRDTISRGEELQSQVDSVLPNLVEALERFGRLASSVSILRESSADELSIPMVPSPFRSPFSRSVRPGFKVDTRNPQYEVLEELRTFTRTNFSTDGEAANFFKISPSYFSMILQGKRAISDAMARELGYEQRWVKSEPPEKVGS